MGELVEITLNHEATTLEVDVDEVQAIVTRFERHSDLVAGTSRSMPGAILIYVRDRDDPFHVIPTDTSRSQVERIRDIKNNPEGITP